MRVEVSPPPYFGRRAETVRIAGERVRVFVPVGAGGWATEGTAEVRTPAETRRIEYRHPEGYVVTIAGEPGPNQPFQARWFKTLRPALAAFRTGKL